MVPLLTTVSLLATMPLSHLRHCHSNSLNIFVICAYSCFMSWWLSCWCLASACASVMTWDWSQAFSATRACGASDIIDVVLVWIWHWNNSNAWPVFVGMLSSPINLIKSLNNLLVPQVTGNNTINTPMEGPTVGRWESPRTEWGFDQGGSNNVGIDFGIMGGEVADCNIRLNIWHSLHHMSLKVRSHHQNSCGMSEKAWL